MSYYEGDYYQGDFFRNIGRAVKKGIRDIGKQAKRSTRDVGRVVKGVAPIAAIVPGLGVAGLAAGLVAKGAKVASQVKRAKQLAQTVRSLTPGTSEVVSMAAPELYATLSSPASPFAGGPEHRTEGTTAPAGSGTSQASKAIKKARRSSYRRRTTAKRKSTRRRRKARRPRKPRTRRRSR